MTPSHPILIGECIDMMRTLPDQSVRCCVTSPPYFELRDYGVDGQIVVEETPAEFIARLAEAFREVRRVLEPCSPNTHNRLSQDVLTQIGSERANGGARSNGEPDDEFFVAGLMPA